MKRLLFFSTVVTLFLSTNAQTGVRNFESVPMQKPSSMERESQSLFAPKEASVLDNYTVYEAKAKPTHKANYQPYEYVTNLGFAQMDVAPTIDDWNFTYLFPDSTAYEYVRYVHNNTYRKIPSWAATGFVFDPYSMGFSANLDMGLFEEDSVLYGYRLDTLRLFADYRLPNGYNSASPDTLRIYLAHLGPYPAYPFNTKYIDYANFMTSSFTTITGNILSPKFVYPSPNPVKGVGPVMKATDRIIDYILTDADSMLVPPGYVAWRRIKIPIEDEKGYGYEVPAGYCLSVMMKFIPGYQYGYIDSSVTPHVSYDTLRIIEYDTLKPKPDWFISEDRRMNTLHLIGWDYTDANRTKLYDSRGYNTFLMETQNIRYKDKSGIGVGTGWENSDGSYIDRSCYAPGYYQKTAAELFLSEGDDTMHRRYQPEIVSVPTYSNNLISNVYPNPAASQLTVDLTEAGKASLAIYNILGQAVMEETLQNISNTINIAELSSGLYFVKVNQNGKSHTVKISKE